MDRSEVSDLSFEWRVAEGLTPYPDAIAAMQARVAAIHEGRAGECVWLVEHPRSTPREPRPRPEIWSILADSRRLTRGAAGNGPTTGPVSGRAM